MHDVYTAFLVSVLQTIPKQIENERERERNGELGHLDFKWTFENLIAEQAQQKTVVSIWNSMVEGQGMSTWVASIAHRGPAQRSSLFFTIISDSHYHFINYSFSLFFLSFFRFLCVCVFFFFLTFQITVSYDSAFKKKLRWKKKKRPQMPPFCFTGLRCILCTPATTVGTLGSLSWKKASFRHVALHSRA